MMKLKIQCQAQVNNMKPSDQPPELSQLNCLERHLIAPVIPFMKISSLPKGAQKGLCGPVVCVVSNVTATAMQLPRLMDDDSLVKVKLKRKLQYKGHHLFQTVNPHRIHSALSILKTINPHYENISIEDENPVDFQEPLQSSTESTSEPVVNRITSTKNVITNCPVISVTITEDTETNTGDLCLVENVQTCHSGNEIEQNSQNLDTVPSQDLSDIQNGNQQGESNLSQTSAPLYTCLQPTDIAQIVAEHVDDTVLCVAPGEGQQFLSIFNSEGPAFTTLFPDGKNTFKEQRMVKISQKRYFNARLLSYDTRFAQNPEYIFFAQYTTELHEIFIIHINCNEKGVKENFSWKDHYIIHVPEQGEHTSDSVKR
ncbi:hypothetical protein HOLleu_29678 [Holothuria leucospilota]|uniref:DUF6570 domain-containing protein n=1 Tax=Holothuria leucospilota TaxID=206669 RepID=A0A9Q1BJB4_HOLLE|nr:hypothetical protein HOLleu_29678 [Holothuria leucospilota]